MTSQILSDYGTFLETFKPDGYAFYDASKLPHSKMEIFQAIVSEFLTADEKSRSALTFGALALSHFQPEIGKEPLFWLGSSMANIPADEASPKRAAQSAHRSNVIGSTLYVEYQVEQKAISDILLAIGRFADRLKQ